MKINWFTTIGLKKNPAADYSALVLPALSKIADVTVWTSDTEHDAEFEKAFRVEKTDNKFPWYRFNLPDINVFNLDLATAPSIMFGEIGRHVSGITIFHGDELAPYLEGRTAREPDVPWEALHDIADACGPDADEYLRNRLVVRGPLPSPGARFLLKACLEQSLGVVTHTSNGARFFESKERWPVCFLDPPSSTTDIDFYASRLFSFIWGTVRSRNLLCADVLRRVAAKGLSPWLSPGAPLMPLDRLERAIDFISGE